MKVIFLDIDGVLNSDRSRLAYNGYPHNFNTFEKPKFDWVAVRMIEKLTKRSDDVSIVVSSSWRYKFNANDFSKAFGFDVLDTTSKSYVEFNSRGEEIKKWLNSTKYSVTHYCIIDDIDDFNEDQKDFFVKTDPQEGFSYKNYLQVCDILDLNH